MQPPNHFKMVGLIRHGLREAPVHLVTPAPVLVAYATTVAVEAAMEVVVAAEVLRRPGKHPLVRKRFCNAPSKSYSSVHP